MMRLWLLVLLAIVAVRADFELLDTPEPQHLQIHNDHIVYLHLGSPGKWLRFRVRDDTPRIYIFQHPSPYSDTWTPLTTRDEYNQPMICDTLGIGNVHVRADIVVGRFSGETSATVEGTQAEGVLGLGADSPLWRVWRDFTRSRDALFLGHVLKRASESSPVAISARLPPPWLYGLDGRPASFATEYRAVLDSDTVTELRKACLDELGDIVDESVDLAGSGDTLADVLGVQPEERLCRVASEYRLLMVPESDYNLVPSELLVHRRDRPPTFRIYSITGDNNDTEPLVSVLFNRFEDGYVEMDTTNAAGTGVRRAANRPVSAPHDNTILLGYGLRRFEATYMLDEERAYVALRHSALSHEGQRRVTEQSVELRRIRDISAIVAGILVFALVAIEPDPVLPRHARASLRRFAHASRGWVDLRLAPKPAAQSTQRPRVGAAPSSRSNSNSTPTVVRDSDGTISVTVPTDQEQIAAAPIQADAPRSPTDTTEAQLRTNARDSALRALALRAAFQMESEWPMPTSSLRFVQFVVESVVALYVVLALAFYDTPWALALVLNRNATSNTPGWVTLAIIFLTITGFSFLASLSIGHDARLGSMALQMEILAGLYVLTISLYQWDLALALLLVMIAASGIVLVMLLGAAWDVMPQYGRMRRSNVHQQLRPVAVFVALPWLVYITTALMPFIISRLWDNELHSLSISVYLIVGVAIVGGAYLTVQPFSYPLALADAVLDRIIDSYQARWSAITGRPIRKDQ